jgi:hypothetical protein
MGVDAPKLFESKDVFGPTLVGVWRPVLLVPVGFLLRLPTRHVDLVLRHELAHLQRLDPLVNFLQALVELVYFFHPAAWWLSARLREEREVACDELAVESHADRLDLARALTFLEGQRRIPVTTLSARGGSLMDRINRLISPHRVPFRPRTLLAPLALLLMATALVVVACDSQQARTFEPRAQPYVDAIEDASERHEVPAELLVAMIGVESNFDPDAESPMGARGLMQLMPRTAESMGVSDVWDPHQNVDGGAAYLRLMLDHYGGDLELATAAYNAGPHAVDEAGGIPDNGETPHYVRAVLDRYESLRREMD